jgi:hypothetical protein
MDLEIDSTNTRIKSELGSGVGGTGESLLSGQRLARLRGRVSPVVLSLFALTAAVYLFVGHVNGKLGPRGGIRRAVPHAVSGDEPHYLVIINSLLFDHDLRIDPDFARIRSGGYEAGAAFRGGTFGGHAVLVNRRTGQNVKCHESCTEASVEALGGNADELAMYPAHPVGFPLLVALLVWPLQPAPEAVEGLVGTVNILISIGGVLLAYAGARRGGLGNTAAIASAILLGFASSWFPYSKSYFSESAIGLFLLLGFLALRTGRPVWSGLAIGVAASMKSVFALCGFAWVLERLWARRYREAALLTASMGVCGLLQMWLNMKLLGSAVTVGAGSFVAADGLQSFKDTLFEPSHGLFPFVPWAVLAFLWGPIGGRPGVQAAPDELDVPARRQLVLPLFLFLAVYSIIGWGPGYCYGPRYWIALLPFLALLAVDFAVSGKKWRLQLTGVLAVAGLLVAVPGAVKYERLFSRPAAASVFEDTPPW